VDKDTDTSIFSNCEYKGGEYSAVPIPYSLPCLLMQAQSRWYGMVAGFYEALAILDGVYLIYFNFVVLIVISNFS
jgi:hypothetical protein